jgi:hypothetical protein
MPIGEYNWLINRINRITKPITKKYKGDIDFVKKRMKNWRIR